MGTVFLPLMLTKLIMVRSARSGKRTAICVLRLGRTPGFDPAHGPALMVVFQAALKRIAVLWRFIPGIDKRNTPEQSYIGVKKTKDSP